MARDLYIDGRVFVKRRGNDGRGHLGLGNPVSVTDLVNDFVIPNIPSLTVLPYTFQNGLTETVGTPSIVELGGTLLRDTTIIGLPYELQFELNKLTNIAGNYSLTAADCNVDISTTYYMRNTVFNAGCGLDFYTQAQLDMPVIIDGNIPATADGSKMTIEGVIGSNQIGSGYYNIIDDVCTPYSTMQQSFINSGTGAYGYSRVTVNGGVEIKYESNNGVANVYTSIGLEGSVSIEAGDINTAFYNRINVGNYEAASFSGINPDTTNPYAYTFPNTTPNNGDIMIADGTGKFQHKPLEIHVQALEKITGDVGQKAVFHLPFIENHACTRINFVSENTLVNNITVEIRDEHNNDLLDTLVLVVSNAVSHWGGHTELTAPLASTNVNRLWSATITANSDTKVTALYLTLTFVPELV